MLLDTDRATIGLHFGMTGRLEVDGLAQIRQLAYASGRDDVAWDRLVMYTTPGGRHAPPALRFNDPRRLGRVSLDADLEHLGLDFSEVTPKRLEAALAGRRGVLKSVLLDQHVVAGLGNLCVDEVLWWAALDPRRTVDSLSSVEIARVAAAIRRRLPVMLERGGSTEGVLGPVGTRRLSTVRTRRHPTRTGHDRGAHDRVVSDTSVLIPVGAPNSWHNRCVVSVADLSSVVASPSSAAVGDAGSSRLVYAMVIGLIVVGVALVVLAVWILRQTRPDLEVLAPLERMGDGDWKRRDPSTQRRMLDEVRPEGAQPLGSPPPPIDADFEQQDHPVASFSDLGPGLGGAVPDLAPLGPDAEPEPEPEPEPSSRSPRPEPESSRSPKSSLNRMPER